MSAPVAERLMTVEELLALPDDGVERWLIRGQLREKPMTRRDRWHAALEARISQLLGNWLDQQPAPRGNVLAGEVGCRLRRTPESAVGIDVVYISAESAAQKLQETNLVDGPPVLAVEILSPNDQDEEVKEKLQEYLAAGVALVWVVDPVFQTVTVYRPDAPPAMVNVTEQLSGESHLPGFTVPVAQVFTR
jgi:Uma2 family endonuclease